MRHDHGTTSPASGATAAGQDWLVAAGSYGVGAAAAVLSWDSLRGLCALIGYHGWLAWIGPACVDLYALTATWAWIGHGTRSRTVRAWARWNALLAIALSIMGNALYHRLIAGLRPGVVPVVDWRVVVAVSAVPPLMLGLAVHLRTLVAADAADRTARQDAALRPAPVGVGDVAAAGEEPTRTGMATGEDSSAGPESAADERTACAGGATKKARLYALWRQMPPGDGRSAYAIAQDLAPRVGMSEGTARRYLREFMDEAPIDAASDDRDSNGPGGATAERSVVLVGASDRRGLLAAAGR